MPAEYRHLAHADVPVPIGWNQTTSQPHLVELMIRLLELRPGHKVLEVGTGSGYQTAILASLPGVDVYSVEIIAALADQARARLHELGLGHVHLAVADGRQGWPEHAPYNGVIVAAAAEDVPPALEAQLAEDGRLVIPIGPPHQEQVLWKLVKRGGRLQGRQVEHVIFVPLTGPSAPEEEA